jgi:hypothetical protein
MNKWVAMLIWLVAVIVMGIVFGAIRQDYYLLPVFVPLTFGFGVALGWILWNWGFLTSPPLKEAYQKRPEQKKRTHKNES